MFDSGELRHRGWRRRLRNHRGEDDIDERRKWARGRDETKGKAHTDERGVDVEILRDAASDTRKNTVRSRAIQTTCRGTFGHYVPPQPTGSQRPYPTPRRRRTALKVAPSR